MPLPDKTKKEVSTTGYDQEDLRPFTENYRELYREQLDKTRFLREELDKYNDAIAGIRSDDRLAKEMRYIHQKYIEKVGEEDA
jgi:uncharacterized Fe-S cluster-containing radical SAM superfamily protein